MKRWMGGFLAALAVGLALLLPIQAAAAAPVTVMVHGTEVHWTDARPYIEGGRTMVPLRAAAEAMGLDVYWDDAERRVDVSKIYTPQNSVYQAELEAGQKEFILQRTVSLWIDKNTYRVSNQYATYDGRSITEGQLRQTNAAMDTSACIRQSRTYVPIRYVAEQFGNDVLWNAASRTVQIVGQVAADWSYAWSIADMEDTKDPGNLVLALHTPVNLSSATITSVQVVCTSAPGSSDGAQLLQTAGTADIQRVQAAAGVTELLHAVRVSYPFRQGQTYQITFKVALTKSNGATTTADDSFRVTL